MSNYHLGSGRGNITFAATTKEPSVQLYLINHTLSHTPVSDQTDCHIRTCNDDTSVRLTVLGLKKGGLPTDGLLFHPLTKTTLSPYVRRSV